MMHRRDDTVLEGCWRDLLACPLCHGTLVGDGPVCCAGCSRAWGVRDGVLDLVPEELVSTRGGAWDRWREALAGLDAWRARQRPVRDGTRTSAALTLDPRIGALVATAGLSGTVVDVGGKDGAKRSAMPTTVRRYLSVDPCATLTSSQQGEPAGLSWGVVRGLAEALPVRDGVADGVFSTAAMDYFVDTARGVAEFARVLRPGGTLALLVTAHPLAVARARGAPSRSARAWRSLTPEVLCAVGLRGALSLAVDGARTRFREHTQYLTEHDVLSTLEAHFALRALARDVGRYSTVLRVVATRR